MMELPIVPPGRRQAETFKVLSADTASHVISAEGVSTDPMKIKANKQWLVPLKATEVSSFLGLASYYHMFIKHFAEMASKKLIWFSESDKAFHTLKKNW